MDIPAEVLDGRRNRIVLPKVLSQAKELPAGYRVIDDANILEKILLRKLTEKPVNGILTVFFALRNGATNEEIENALVSEFLFTFYNANSQRINKWASLL